MNRSGVSRPVVPGGLIVIDKPSGPTSQDVVKRVKALLRVKVGHTGTLDPMATGVLPVVLGSATRLARFLQASDKEYLAEIQLGLTTDTLDRQGRVLERNSVPRLNEEKIEEVLDLFRGEIRQQVPFFSAVRVDGNRLYKLARKGEKGQEVERPWRNVSIYQLELLGSTPSILNLRVHCSSGTYLRAMAHDIGQRLGCGGCLTSLRRLRCGELDLSQAVGLEQLADGWQKALQPVERLLPELPRIDLGPEQARLVRHGNSTLFSGAATRGTCRLFHDQKLLAVGEMDASGLVQPSIVLWAADSSPLQKT